MDAQQAINEMAQAIQQALLQQGYQQHEMLQAILEQLSQSPAAAAAVPTAPNVVTFARSPALTNDEILDYSTEDGAAIYKGAPIALGNVFDITKPNVVVLLFKLKDRASSYGWNGILTINNTNLLQAHGTVTLDACRTHVSAFINGAICQAQNDYQLLCFLKASVKEETIACMSGETECYSIAGLNPEDPTNQSGVIYLKLLLFKALADTRSVSSVIHNKLARLPEYMAE